MLHYHLIESTKEPSRCCHCHWATSRCWATQGQMESTRNLSICKCCHCTTSDGSKTEVFNMLLCHLSFLGWNQEWNLGLPHHLYILQTYICKLRMSLCSWCILFHFIISSDDYCVIVHDYFYIQTFFKYTIYTNNYHRGLQYIVSSKYMSCWNLSWWWVLTVW